MFCGWCFEPLNPSSISYLHEIKSTTSLAARTKGKRKTPTPPYRLILSIETNDSVIPRNLIRAVFSTQVPVAFLELAKEDFTKEYGGGKAATAVGNSLNKEFCVACQPV